MSDIRLSKNFMLSEMCKSSTAARLGIDNVPTDQKIIDKLKAVCENILQPVRAHYGKPFIPNSGYRCLALNRAVHSKDSSQHRKGEAVDFELAHIPNEELAKWCRDNLDFDQLIFEFGSVTDGNAGWVHCSYVSPTENRKQVLTINRKGVHVGIV